MRLGILCCFLIVICISENLVHAIKIIHKETHHGRSPPDTNTHNDDATDDSLDDIAFRIQLAKLINLHEQKFSHKKKKVSHKGSDEFRTVRIITDRNDDDDDDASHSHEDHYHITPLRYDSPRFSNEEHLGHAAIGYLAQPFPDPLNPFGFLG